MKHAYLIVMVAVVLGLGLAVLAGPSVMANDRDGPKVIDPDSVVYGRTYSEWSAEWWQWAFSVPVAIHPLFDHGDCSTGQAGPVWFLGGATASGTYVRSCNVPAETALFFPILNGEDSSLEESMGNGCEDPTFDGTIAGLRRCTEWGPGETLRAEIDGAPVHQLATKYRTRSTVFDFTLPDDNWLKATTGKDYLAGAYFPSAGDGWYLMLSPLHAGNHVIHFYGSCCGGGFTLDVTYNLNVAK